MKKILLILGLIVCYLTNFAQEIGTFKDPRDGKVYKTVKIEAQTWFAENLAYKSSDGNYWAYNNDTSNVKKYGYLYDWKTAKNVVPVGWHLPSKKEWNILYSSLGNNDEKVFTNAINVFNIMLAGCRYEDGHFVSIEKATAFWSTDLGYNKKGTANAAYYFYCETNKCDFLPHFFPLTYGLSVRLLKD